jgi:hypothetical protein
MKMHAVEESIESQSMEIRLRHLQVKGKVGPKYIHVLVTHIANLVRGIDP